MIIADVDTFFAHAEVIRRSGIVVRPSERCLMNEISFTDEEVGKYRSHPRIFVWSMMPKTDRDSIVSGFRDGSRAYFITRSDPHAHCFDAIRHEGIVRIALGGKEMR